jgi:membrane protease subunit HflK
MPWDNNTGGGRGPNEGGPWGQAPKGGGGGGPRRGGTPSLEEILNRGRDRFQGGLPGGRWALVGGVLVLLAFWGVNAIYTIDPQEVGVQLRFGRPMVETGPGLHFHWWPIESVERVTVTENQTEIGTINAGRNSNDEGLMLSGDQNIVDVKFSLLWSVSSPRDYLFNVRDPEDMVRSVGESAMREVVGRRPAQDIFRDDRAGIALEVRQIAQTILDSYKLGVTVSQIAIENVAPPTEVADAFDEVQRAEQDEDRFQEEARSYANTLLGDARGQAAQMREDAAAYKNRVVQEAEGEAARFTSVYEEYAKAPEVTRKRLFLETMEQVLGGSEKVIVESGTGNGVVPYLPLPELRNNSTTTPAAPR